MNTIFRLGLNSEKNIDMIAATEFERAQIRLRAFKLLEGWGNMSPTPEAKNALDRFPVPWDLQTRMKYAGELAEWALTPSV